MKCFAALHKSVGNCRVAQRRPWQADRHGDQRRL